MKISNTELKPHSRVSTAALFHALRALGPLHANAEVPRLHLKLAAVLGDAGLCQGGGGADTSRSVGLS